MGSATDLIFDFATLSPITITRFTTGQTLDDEGVFVNGTTETLEVDASIQPLTDKEMQSLPEGDRTKRWYKGYCAIELFTSSQITGKKADLVSYDDSTFEVRGVQRWVGDFNHWKFKMAEVNPPQDA